MIDLTTRLQRIADDVPAWLRSNTASVPSASLELGLIGQPSVVARMSPVDRARRDAVRLRILVAALTGDRLKLDEAEVLAGQRDVMARVLSVRHTVYDQLLGFGRVELTCPACSARRSMSLADIAAVVGVNPPQLADADGEPSLPSLAIFFMRGARPAGLPSVARLDVTFPAAGAGLETSARSAVLGPPLTPVAVADAQRRWARDESAADPALVHRRGASPAFQVLLRVMCLCSRVDGDADVGLDRIEALPVVDVLFVDAVHHMLYATDIRELDRAVVPCLACRMPYSIVR